MCFIERYLLNLSLKMEDTSFRNFVRIELIYYLYVRIAVHGADAGAVTWSHPIVAEQCGWYISHNFSLPYCKWHSRLDYVTVGRTKEKGEIRMKSQRSRSYFRP